MQGNFYWKHLHITRRKNKNKLQIFLALYIKINKPSFSKINFEYSSHMLLTLFQVNLPLYSSKNSFSTCSLYKCTWLVVVFVISLFVPSMDSVGDESARGKYSAFLNSFHPEIKQLIGRQQKNDKIGRHEVSLLFNQCLKQKILLIYIYI